VIAPQAVRNLQKNNVLQQHGRSSSDL
jgi:hypothetical protein